MPFIQTAEGHYVNIDHVTEMRVRPAKEGRLQHVSLYAGERLLGDCYLYETVPFRQRLVPAAPGYSLLNAFIDETGGCLGESPIIAFGYGEGGAVPFTLDGPCADSHQPWAIKCPSGAVVKPEDQDFENSEAFLAHEIDQYRQRKEREAKRKAEADTKATAAE